MAMKFDADRSAETVATMKKVLNSDVIEAVSGIAVAINESSDGNDNPLVEKLLEACKSFQGVYNSYVPGADALIREFEKIEEIRDRVNRLEIGEVGSVDAGFTATQIDVDAIC